jgi:hypothetical protein
MYSGPAFRTTSEVEPQYQNGLEVPHIYRRDVQYVKDEAEIERQRKWRAAGMAAPSWLDKNNPVYGGQEQNANSLPKPLPVIPGTGTPRRYDDGNGAL